ncbi:hypothetical protein GCM10009802_36840 [Streptomyces synnematoformans]|uniref:Uncharacterized protein n=1 Tax=Streptomyces synnematoformans TaxID=415721 RepID=A0ABP5KDU2_9ACTN
MVAGVAQTASGARQLAAAGGGGLHGGHRADDGQRGLQLRAQHGQGVHGGGVAGDDEHVRPVRGGGPRTGEHPLPQVGGRPRPPGHAVGVGGQHQLGVVPQAPYGGGGRQQPESGVHKRDLHAVTLDECVRSPVVRPQGGRRRGHRPRPPGVGGVWCVRSQGGGSTA